MAFGAKKAYDKQTGIAPVKKSSILLTAAWWLRRSVDEVFRLSEVGGLQP